MAPVCNAEDYDVVAFDGTRDDVPANDENTRANAQAHNALAAHMRKACQQNKPVCNGLDQAISDLDALALFGDAMPARPLEQRGVPSARSRRLS